MRKPHYWKRAGRSSHPSEIVVIDCETWYGDRVRVDGGELHQFRLGVGVAYRLERGKRTREVWRHTNDRRDLRDLILSRLNKHRPVWVWGHNLAYDLGAAGLWSLVMSEDYKVDKAALTSGILWIKGAYQGNGLIFADTFNYYKSSLAAIGKVVGIPKMTMPDIDAPDRVWYDYCHNDVEITARAIDDLLLFLRENECGPFQPTVAGAAFSTFRHRFMSHKVLVHSYKGTLTVERSAYYGGIVDCAFIGKCPGTPVYELDVVSMYPGVCREELPSRIVGYSDKVGVSGISNLMKQYLAVADVTISTDKETYPYRVKKGVVHAQGVFRTCLADPELRLAISRGHVLRIHHAAWYHAVPIFKTYMEEIGRWKVDYSENGNDVFALLSKYLLNSLYGKTGQLTPKWVMWGEESLQVIEDKHGLKRGALSAWYESPPDLYEREEIVLLPGVPNGVQVRDYWGFVEINAGHAESRDSCPAIAATITSLARCLLRRYQAIAGVKNWYYSDTDSIWTNEQGYANLVTAGAVGTGEIGTLSLKGTHDYLIVHGPKDYQTPTMTKLKGVRSSARLEEDGTYTQLHFPSAQSQLFVDHCDGVFVREVNKTLHRRVDKCTIGPDGWTTPIIIRE